MRTRRPGHVKAFDYVGFHRYFLTFCTYKRCRIFTTQDRVDIVLKQFLRTGSLESFSLVAYAFMPDHAHALIEGLSEISNGLRFIARAKQLSGFEYHQAFGERLWQRYGYERTLREKDSTLGVARYIVENPVRAGLVQRVMDYPFVGSPVYSLEQIVEAVQMDGSWKSG